ncbi:hypothetical protein SmJEL517_g02721 [Synchytrium microbalum]|uniref:Uncharacterized protein n=1 Tax=Synchytrium microbalum TaxID=1806994 RepID=A0A507C599_9FUNG|nr:uncharacterized protein SmJEL517_g02721 [Synchytrium microbalum]TPX34661.1 hypothetical protein SmJEL517_g02721 [Synchytrium microbalum]
MATAATVSPVESLGERLGQMKEDVKLAKDSRTADLIFGSVAGFTGKIVEFPFDTVKVRLQTQPLPEPGTAPRFRGAIDCFIKTVRSEGVLGLYKGLSPPLVGSMVENSVLFFSYNHIQNLIRTHTSSNPNEALSVQQLALAGFLSGGVVSFILTPIELVKCKLQVQDVNRLYNNNNNTNNSNTSNVTTKPSIPSPTTSHPTPKARPPRIPFSGHPSEPPPPPVTTTTATTKTPLVYRGPIHVISHTIKTHGVAGLYQGQFGTFLREAGGGAAWFGVYELVCRWIVDRDVKLNGKEDLSPIQLMGAGALAGMSYNAALFPADVIKSRQQTAEELGLSSSSTKIGRDGKPKRPSFFQVGRDLYRGEGIRGFYRGCTITVARSAPTSAVIFLTYEMLSRNFTF